ncbi:MAG: orotidine-5'-phosphate decarboxylase [Rickettsiales bacterium]|nr:orotidine-5'-phosphate decarboxylase [Rickettsiales bacterium]
MSKPCNPIICAVDTTDVDHAAELTSAVHEYVGGIKLGLEYFTANGAVGVRRITDLKVPVFLDLKFHDIPNTVAKAIAATAGINTFMMTVHTAGGRAMLTRAIEASNEVSQMTGKERPYIIGVTILTSLDQDDLDMIGYKDRIDDQVKRLADLAQSSGLDGVVCSPYEIELIRQTCGDEFKLIVPGIRPEGSQKDDQKRTLSPKEAIERGADYLVIGRPITKADDYTTAAKAICSSL